ncbi:MAG: sigma-70 family RNA polymerase sigma factor [Saprospiraceae bacterium]
MHEADLISAIKTGGYPRELALKQIYLNQQLKLNTKNHLIKFNCPDYDFEDLFQEAIIVMDRNIRNGQFEERGTLEAYLFKICKYLWFNELRRNKKHVSVEILENLEKSVTFDQVQTQYDEDLLILLDLTLKKMDDRCRKVLELWRLSYSMTEIKNIMNLVSEGMARKIKYNCLNKLSELIIKNKTYF